MQAAESKEAPCPSQVAEMLDVAKKLIEHANSAYKTVRLPCGSKSLAFAVEAGLPPQMAYTVQEAARFTGVDVQTLYREHTAGRIRFVLPKGNVKGNRIRVDELDRWMEENES